MYKLEVGKPYIEGKTRWPDASQFVYDRCGLMLSIFAGHLKESEIEAVRKGQVELAIYENQPAVFLLYRIKGFGPWSDVPYSIHLVSPENRPDIKPLIIEGQKLLMTIILVDADTGIIKALRAVSTSTAFTVALNQAVMRQAKQTFSQTEYNRHVNSLYARYSSDQMAVMAEGKHRAGE